MFNIARSRLGNREVNAVKQRYINITILTIYKYDIRYHFIAGPLIFFF